MTGPWLRLLVLGATISTVGCVSQTVRFAHTVELVTVESEIPEEELLDVAVVVLDSGVPEGEVDQEVLEALLKDGVFTNIRRAESRFMAVHLKDTLQESGYWGAVRTTPTESLASDVNVTGKILQSDGDRLRLEIIATDATGRTLFEQTYAMETAAAAYDARKYPNKDPYQDVFNRISNDLAAAYDGLSGKERREIRQVSQLRFAGDLSPEAFGNHLEEKRGRYEIKRLPAVDDPQFDRALRVREREYLFVDTLNDHYDKFYRDIDDPYDSWRRYAREEAVAVRELNAEKRWRYLMGGLTVAMTLIYSRNSDNDFSDRVLTNAGTYMGMELIKSGFMRREEARMHAATLEELSNGFEDEVAPVVVEIQGTTRRLTGNAAAQYEEWRTILRDLYEAETGLVADVVIYSEEPELVGQVTDPAPPQVEDEADDSEGPGGESFVVPDGAATADVGAVAGGEEDAAAEAVETTEGNETTESSDDDGPPEG